MKVDDLIKKPLSVLKSNSAYIFWAIKNPLASYIGGKRLASHVDDVVPGIWRAEMSEKRVVIVGTGPSLDRADGDFFKNYDTAIYVNFALKLFGGVGAEYFFSTDVARVREVLGACEIGVFNELGRDRCIIAPIFLDQWHLLTQAGLDLFTLLRFDQAAWRTQKVRVGPIRLPLVVRYSPRQPDWDTFTIPSRGKALPIMDHTSAFTAILFAAMNGAKEIGLIGCDFSAGSAQMTKGAQIEPTAQTFSGAAQEFERLQAALRRSGVEVVNYSKA